MTPIEWGYTMAGSGRRALNLPLMSFDTAEEVAKLKAGRQWQRESRAAITLVKNDAMRIVLVALHARAILKEHHAEGPIAVSILERAVRFKASGEERILKRGAMLALEGGVAHEVEALEECAFEVTVVKAAKPS